MRSSLGVFESLSNIWRCWVPMQIKSDMAIATDQVDEDGVATKRAKYGFHMLRHAAASLFISQLAWTPKKLQTIMGHSSIVMTFDPYGHLFEDAEADSEAMEKIVAA
jgi:integrase